MEKMIFFSFFLNLSFHRFCRKGKAGSYREEMSEELIKRFDVWIAENLKDTDFRFKD